MQFPRQCILLVLLIGLFTNSALAQWSAVDIDFVQYISKLMWSPGDSGDVFIAGYGNADSSQGPYTGNGWFLSVYNGSNVIDIGKFDNPVRSVQIFQGDTIVAGSFDEVDGTEVSRVARLQNGNWQAFGEFNTSVRAKVIGNEIFFFGTFTEAQGYATNVIKYNGETWTPVGPPIPASFAHLEDIALFDGQIYIAGNLLTYDDIHDILVLTDGEWQAVGESVSANFAWFNRMEIYQGELHVAGLFLQSDGFVGQGIQKWDGNNWHEVGNSVYGSSINSTSQVFDMKVYGDFLYISGEFHYTDQTPIKFMARWDGMQWCGFNTEDFISSIDDFAITDDTLYMSNVGGIPGEEEVSAMYQYPLSAGVNPCSPEINTAISVVNERNSYSLGPNPAVGDLVQIQFEKSLTQPRIELFTLSGQFLFAKNLRNTGSTIDVSHLSPGIYVLQVLNGNETLATEKLVVQ